MDYNRCKQELIIVEGECLTLHRSRCIKWFWVIQRMCRMFVLIEEGIVTVWENKDMWWLKQSSPIENATNYRVLQYQQISMNFNLET